MIEFKVIDSLVKFEGINSPTNETGEKNLLIHSNFQFIFVNS